VLCIAGKYRISLHLHVCKLLVLVYKLHGGIASFIESVAPTATIKTDNKPLTATVSV
jgi:hypothetical protein